jgi:hypothetical protein
MYGKEAKRQLLLVAAGGDNPLVAPAIVEIKELSITPQFLPHFST